MRVNHNIPALTALRYLDKTNMATTKNLEKLSSGMKINSAADGPAQLVISEHMRAQIAGIDQAIDNSETSISMVQTAEGALQEVNDLLINLRQLAIHAANAGANDDKMLEADQTEVENLIVTLRQIANYTQFGTKPLLDGSNGANGMVVGDGFRFVKADLMTDASPERGYEIDIIQVATRSHHSGTVAIDAHNAKGNLQFTINEGKRFVSFSTDTKEVRQVLDKIIENYERYPELHSQAATNKAIRDTIARQFQQDVEDAGLNVDVYIDEAGMLTVQHQQFGSAPSFTVTGNVDGMLSPKANVGFQAEKGRDVAGTLGGHTAIGEGQFLTGAEGTMVEGLTVEYHKALGTQVIDIIDERTGELAGREVIREDNDTLAGKDIEGYVHVSQNSLSYQVGPNQGENLRLNIGSVAPSRLGNNVKNESGFRSLKDINLTDVQGATDSIGIIDEAISEVSEIRGKLGAFQKNALGSTLGYLRVAGENLINAESVIRDTDMAAEMSDFTKNQILMASGTAMAAQANQTPKAVLQLLAGAQG